jgi:hypothetical protein
MLPKQQNVQKLPKGKRVHSALKTEVRKHQWWVGVQGSFKEIKAALQAADPSLKGNALTKKANAIFFGEMDLHEATNKQQKEQL